MRVKIFGALDKSSKMLAAKSSKIHCETALPVVTEAVETDGYLNSRFEHNATHVEVVDGKLCARSSITKYNIRTRTAVPRTGFMIVGLGGNNGTTLTAGLIANRRGLRWETQVGEHRANWLGSVAMMGTVKLGQTKDFEDVYVPVRSLLPMLHPDDLAIGGWDISGLTLSEAMKRAKVLPLPVQAAVADDMSHIQVLAGVYSEDFIATNQKVRADHTIKGSKQEQLDQLRKDIREFKTKHDLEKVVVLWSGNTERFSLHEKDVHDTADNLLQAIKNDHVELAPSLLYAVAAILEGCAYINGSPQNTFCNGLLELATREQVYLAGDDLKTGQTKFKSVITDFLVSTALKPTSIVSYNHLGNNDGLNLSSEKQFKSKEITKASVVDDMIASNSLLYPKVEDHPDHLIVIKYIPSVGDSKRALDEYTAEIFMDGHQTFVVHNTCEDSLLAVPILLDLILFTELLQRIEIKKDGSSEYSRV